MPGTLFTLVPDCLPCQLCRTNDRPKDVSRAPSPSTAVARSSCPHRHPLPPRPKGRRGAPAILHSCSCRFVSSKRPDTSDVSYSRKGGIAWETSAVATNSASKRKLIKRRQRCIGSEAVHLRSSSQCAGRIRLTIGPHGAVLCILNAGKQFRNAGLGPTARDLQCSRRGWEQSRPDFPVAFASRHLRLICCNLLCRVSAYELSYRSSFLDSAPSNISSSLPRHTMKQSLFRAL